MEKKEQGRINLLPEGKYYKANLHCHTTVPDGKLTAAEIKEIYQKHGYSIVAYTDHCVYERHEELNDEKFLAIGACEVNINEEKEDWAVTKVYHLNLYDMDPAVNRSRKQENICPDMAYEDIEEINAYLERMEQLGFWICYNHPYWSLQTEEDFLPLKHVSAMEIYNHGCELDGLYGYNPRLYDAALRSGKRWFCVATDDNHNGFPEGDGLCDSFGGFTMICPEEFSYQGVMEALKKGRFYASMGPEFHKVYVENNVLFVETSPVEKIYVAMRGRDCYRKAAAPGQTITQASFPLNGEEGYIRVEIRDEKGRYADTNAWLPEEYMR